jgi:hypothetical protein
LNARRGNRVDQYPDSEFNIEEEFKMFQEDMDKKGIEVECDLQRFTALSINQERGRLYKKSIIEAKGALQAEGEGIVFDVQRPTNPAVKLDFQAGDTST